MTTVRLRLPATLTGLAHADSIEFEGGTVRDLLNEVRTTYPRLADRLLTPSGAFHPYVALFHDKTDVRQLGGFDAVLPDGGEVFVVSAMAGG